MATAPARCPGGRKRRQPAPTAALLAPAGLYVGVVVAAGLLLAVYLSATDAVAGSLTGRFVGLGNFSRALRDSTALRAMRNTAIVALTSQTLATGLAVVLACFLARPFRGRRLFLFLILLPSAAPVALGALGWKWMFDSLFSVLNWALQSAHLIGAHDNPQWLGDPGLAMVSIVVVETWRSLPFSTIVLMAGLASLPSELDDAARIDGATGWRKLRYITLPLLAPTIAVSALVGMIFAASGMAIVQVLTAGGPLNSTHVVSSWAFQTGITSGELGAGAAVALLSVPPLAAASLLVLRLVRRVEPGL
jgi:multiple sugar transport system permease protein